MSLSSDLSLSSCLAAEHLTMRPKPCFDSLVCLPYSLLFLTPPDSDGHSAMPPRPVASQKRAPVVTQGTKPIPTKAQLAPPALRGTSTFGLVRPVRTSRGKSNNWTCDLPLDPCILLHNTCWLGRGTVASTMVSSTPTTETIP